MTASESAKNVSVWTCRALGLIALGGLLAGCNAQPEYTPPPSPETQANQACAYLGQGPGSPAYRTCHARVIRQLESPTQR